MVEKLPKKLTVDTLKCVLM